MSLPINGLEYLMSFYLKVRLLVLLLRYRVHWESPSAKNFSALGAGLDSQ